MQYVALAHFELGAFSQAAQTMSRIKERFADQWADADPERMALYRRTSEPGEKSKLGAEAPAHAVYCESDWLLDRRG